MTNKQIIRKLRVMGLDLRELELTAAQTKTGAQNEINQAINRITYAIMALS